MDNVEEAAEEGLPKKYKIMNISNIEVDQYARALPEPSKGGHDAKDGEQIMQIFQILLVLEPLFSEPPSKSQFQQKPLPDREKTYAMKTRWPPMDENYHLMTSRKVCIPWYTKKMVTNYYIRERFQQNPVKSRVFRCDSIF